MTSRSNSIAFDGPVELVQFIFDTAARQEKSTALKLVRVCKAARLWVTPIIYETVVLDNPSALRFESMLSMSSASELTSRIKYLRATCLPNVDVLSKRCSKIRAITLANYDVHHLSRLALPSLTHLTVGGFLAYSHFSPSMSAFATITHLRFPNDVPRLPDDFATALPNLTHFSCVLSAPALHVALVYMHNHTPRAAEDLVADITPARDPRVVVASSRELPDEWQNLSPTYDSLWTFAEKELEKRRTHELASKSRITYIG